MAPPLEELSSPPEELPPPLESEEPLSLPEELSEPLEDSDEVAAVVVPSVVVVPEAEPDADVDVDPDADAEPVVPPPVVPPESPPLVSSQAAKERAKRDVANNRCVFITVYRVLSRRRQREPPSAHQCPPTARSFIAPSRFGNDVVPDTKHETRGLREAGFESLPRSSRSRYRPRPIARRRLDPAATHRTCLDLQRLQPESKALVQRHRVPSPKRDPVHIAHGRMVECRTEQCPRDSAVAVIRPDDNVREIGETSTIADHPDTPDHPPPGTRNQPRS